jgi:flagellar protein FlbD
MIHLTRLNHLPLVLNADLIESIEVTPDTVISLTTGQKLVVLEPAEEVVRRVVEFRRAILGGCTAPADQVDAGGNRIGHARDRDNCSDS